MQYDLPNMSNEFEKYFLQYFFSLYLKVEIVLQQEYIILHKLDIYGKLENFIYSDLCSLWDMKLEKYCDYDAFDDLEEFRKKPNPNEESQKAINKLNEIMSEYF